MGHQNKMPFYSMISYIRMESFFPITETAIKWLKVQLGKLKYGATIYLNEWCE
jgi:hypothetical protein